MNHRAATRTARTLWGVATVLVAGSFGLRLLGILNGHALPLTLSDLALGLGLTGLQLFLVTMGVLVIARQAENVIGWLFCVCGLVLALTFVGDAYASSVQWKPGPPLPGFALGAWFANLVGGPSLFGPFAFLFLLFPNGRLLSPRWRIVAWLAGIALAVITVTSAFQPGRLQNYAGIENPLALDLPDQLFGTALTLSFVLLLMVLLASAASLVVRFRRSRGEERQQLKWFASSTVLVALVIASGPILWQLPDPAWLIAFFTAVLSVPIAITIAILKYRLYDIDLIINRALVYGSLTLSLAGLYIGGVIALQALFRTVAGQSSDLAIVISTLTIAALFTPWRRRLQAFIDRRFYRRKYDAARTLASFQVTLRDQVDLEQLAGDLEAVIRETMQPAHVGLWIRPGSQEGVRG